MKAIASVQNEDGRAASYVLLWLLGVPLPVLLILYLLFHH